MALADCGTANSPELLHSMVGETIIGTVQDFKGRWVLIVRSGHGLVFSGGENGLAFYRLSQDDVRLLIDQRRAEVATLLAAAETLMHLTGEIKD